MAEQRDNSKAKYGNVKNVLAYSTCRLSTAWLWCPVGIYESHNEGSWPSPVSGWCSISYVRAFISRHIGHPVVETNSLRRNTGLLWHPTFQFTFSRFPLVPIYQNMFGRLNSWVSCALTAFVWDRTRASGFVVRRANHCTAEGVLWIYIILRDVWIFSSFGTDRGDECKV